MAAGRVAGEILAGFDVGGSNVRARIAVLRDGHIAPHPELPEVLSRPAGDRASVADFVGEVVERIGGTPDRAAVAFAGPITADRVQMTNWPEPREIRRSDLVGWGLPEDCTAMFNDVEAGAYGLVRRLCVDGIEAPEFQALRVSEASAPPGDATMTLVMPGTGLGCAGIVRLPSGEGEHGFLPLASEGGHLAAAPLDDDHATLVDRLRRDLGHGAPSWEDFVSGDGLQRIYRHVRGSDGAEADLLGADDPAAAIAEAARGGDGHAAAALTLYYRCVGRFAQCLALAYRATGGVFIGGGSTRANREFIVSSPLIEEFLASPEQRGLLERMPVYLVLEHLNLPGTLAVATRMKPAAP